MDGPDPVIEDERWRAALPELDALARRCFEAAAGHEPKVAGDVAILFDDDPGVRRLNAQFRGKDQPTNVLSFPAGEDGRLGDIALALDTCRREAEAAGIALADHAAHLIVHGLLHLVGYDHETDDDATRMESLEIAILDALGVSNPYNDDERT